jgi:hypothetical protein
MACFRDYRARLKPGERVVVMVLAADKDQGAVVFDYIKAFFENVELLASLVDKLGKESIQLTNHVTIRVQVASFRRLRGRTVACAIWMNVPSGTATKRAGTPTPRSSRP